MEGDDVAGLHVEDDDPMSGPFGVDVGDQLEAIIGLGVGDVVDEAARDEPSTPAMGASHELAHRPTPVQDRAGIQKLTFWSPSTQ